MKGDPPVSELPSYHDGVCLCDEGEFHGDKVHDWSCTWLACVLGECECESLRLALLEEDADRYLEESLTDKEA